MRNARLIVAGPRDLDDYAFVDEAISDWLFYHSPEYLEIVSGDATGVDANGWQFAVANDIPLKLFPADWDNEGRAAGIIRNTRMGKYATDLLAIKYRNRETRGTNHMIDYALKKKLRVTVVHYEPKEKEGGGELDGLSGGTGRPWWA